MIGLISLVVVLAALLALLIFSDDILGADPSKLKIGLLVGVVIAMVAIAQMYFTRKEVFAPTTLDKILEVFVKRFVPDPPQPPPPAPQPEGAERAGPPPNPGA